MQRRAATILVIVAAAIWVAPAPILAVDSGDWTPVFSDSFDDPGALPPGCAAYDGAPEDPSDGAEASYFRPEAVTVSGGWLHLALLRRTYGGKPFITGELRCLGAAQQYGRYEFRARVPVGAGISSIVMLRPVDQQTAQHASQLEITARPGEETALVRNGSGADISVRTLPGPFSDWHSYAIEWSPAGFKVFVDNKERAADPGASTAQRWFGFAVTMSGPGASGTSTALPAEFQVDYLRVYAFTPTSPLSAAAAPPSTVHNAMPGAPGTPASHRWSRWLAVAATVMAAAALLVLVVHKTRPHRPPPSHRA